MSMDEIDLSTVEASKEFGLAKPTTTQLRITEVTLKTVEGKDYKHSISVFTEFETRDGIEPVDPTTSVSAPIVNLYVHNAGSLGIVRQLVEAFGGSWGDVTTAEGTNNAEKIYSYIKNTLIGRSATAKLAIRAATGTYPAQQKVRFVTAKS